MKAFIVFSILFVLCSFVAIGQTPPRKVVVLDIDPITLWGTVKISKHETVEMDVRSIRPALVKLAPRARKALRVSTKLIRRIERRYR